MGWKLAPCLKRFLDDANKRWPNRNRASDGTIGDAAHRKRKSDHNPSRDGYVYAVDLTHDPANGVDCHVLSRQVIRDIRVSYVIWDGKIYKAYDANKGWQKYRGPNPHTKHMHVSVLSELRDDVEPWPWSEDKPTEEEVNNLLLLPVLRLKSPMMRGSEVKTAQKLLGIEADGIFGEESDRAVRVFQHKAGLKIDGAIGPSTWRELFKKGKA